LVFEALTHMIQTTGGAGAYGFSDFYAALKAVDAGHGGGHAAAIDEAFDRHNLGPLAVDYAPLAWADDAGLADLDPSDPSQVALRWHPLPGAVSYDVLMAPVGHVYQALGLAGNLEAIATAVTDTAYTYATRDSMTEYVFSVVGVDESGQAGYMSAPGFVGSTSAVSVEPIAPGGTTPRHVWSTPNPFAGRTTIHFGLGVPTNVSVRILDVGGRLVRSLVRGPLAAGQHRYEWDGRDEVGRRLAAGVYVVVIEGGGHRQAGKILLLR
jgi:hypothetical protein